MWSTASLWLEITLVNIIFTLAHITMRHFEGQAPKWKRITKYVLVVTMACLFSHHIGKPMAIVLLDISILPALYIHMYFLPEKKGIHGVTGVPKSKYYELSRCDQNI